MKTVKSGCKFNTIKVSQPLADFYVFSIKAKDLLDICESVRLVETDEVEKYSDLEIPFAKVSGTQRPTNNKKINQIKDYILSGDASFPNSIILGANINNNGFLDESELKWSVNENGELIIPANSNVSAIIDGQHRVLGFKKVFDEDPNNENLDMDVVCSLFLDLPMSYHAQIFTQINSTPLRVNRNLIYQLYQIDMDKKKPELWSPEVLSVFMARGLDNDERSPFFRKIKMSVKNNSETNIKPQYTFATLVESILFLISENPMADKTILATESSNLSAQITEQTYATRDVLSQRKDKAPLRELYLKQKDNTLYNIILNFTKIINENLLQEDSIFKKSIGLRACFLALLDVLLENQSDYDDALVKIDKGMKIISLSNLPKTPSTKVQGVLKNIILFSIKKTCNIQYKIKIEMADRHYYDNCFKI